jgi:anti-sigma regulatory factor (Ser/Thr protein kinase)
MERSMSLRIRNDLDELSRVAEWVNSCAEQLAIAERTAQYVDLCAAEVVTNIMTHGFDDADPHEIALSLGQRDDEVVLEIEDDGVAYDPTAASEPAPATLETTRIGGWGIRIVRRFSNEVLYRRNAGHNCLTLVFRQASTAAA